MLQLQLPVVDLAAFGGQSPQVQLRRALGLSKSLKPRHHVVRVVVREPLHRAHHGVEGAAERDDLEGVRLQLRQLVHGAPSASARVAVQWHSVGGAERRRAQQNGCCTLQRLGRSGAEELDGRPHYRRIRPAGLEQRRGHTTSVRRPPRRLDRLRRPRPWRVQMDDLVALQRIAAQPCEFCVFPTHVPRPFLLRKKASSV